MWSARRVAMKTWTGPFGLAFCLLIACEGEVCELDEQRIPLGYCGEVECNTCSCRETDEGPQVICTLAGCLSLSGEPDPCWVTGPHRLHCSAEPVFGPCDAELTPEERCVEQFGGGCDLQPTGQCGFADPTGDLARCLSEISP